MNSLALGTASKSFDAAAVSVSNGTAFAMPAVATSLTWQTSFAVAPDSITVLIQTSNDNSNWNTGDTSTVVGGEIRTFTTSALFVRARISAQTGSGTQLTVTLVAKQQTTTALVGASNTEVLYVDGTAVTGNALFTFNKTTNQLRLGSGTGLLYPSSGQLAFGRDPTGSSHGLIVVQNLADDTRIEVLGVTTGSAGDNLLDFAEGNIEVNTDTGATSLFGPVTHADDVIIADGKAIKTDTTTAHTAILQAYDVDGTAYKTFATLTNGNTPSLAIIPPSGGSVTLQATTFKSSDGTSGATAGPFTTITAITVKNGLVTTLTGS